LARRSIDDPPNEAGSAHFGAGFGPLVTLRVLTVVNDNLLRWLAIGLGKKAVAGGQVALVLTIGTAGFVLPFVLLAWLAGWLADRQPKRSVIVWCKFAEIFIAAAAAAAIAWGVRSGGEWLGLPGGLWLLLATVVVIGCQAALLAPSVIGTIPETVPAARLSSANGVFAMATLAATLVGMAGGNWLADGTTVPGPGELHSAPPWLHAVPAGIVLVGLAAAGWLASLWLRPLPAADPAARPPWNALARTWSDLRELFRARELAAAAAGIVFFWALGAVAQLNVDQYATEAGARSQGQIVPLLVVLVGGIGIGSLVAGRVSSRGVDLGLVPVGAAIMAVASFGLACGPQTLFQDGGGLTAAWWFAAACLGLLGVGAGVFDVPLEAFFQERSPPPRRGALLAATNLLTFAGMFAASMLYGALRTPVGEAARPLLSARGLFGLFGLLAALAAAAAIYAAPRASLRMLVSAVVNTFYRFRIRGADLVPLTGPAVIVANHLSWLDGFLLPLSCGRPVRMVVYGPNIRGKFLRMLSDQWRFILFDPRPKSIGTALKTIQAGLAEGDVIGIFCEGGISRTGQILGFKRGLEWLLGRVEAPIVPAHIDGMWGSLLSHSEGRYFTKWPKLFFGNAGLGFRRPLTLSFGAPLPVGTHPNEARLAVQELTATSVRRRMLPSRPPAVASGIDWAAARATAEAFDGCCLVRRGDLLLASLAAGDPLHDSLGTHAGPLLGIRSRQVDPSLAARDMAELLIREKPNLWLARVDQVAAVAASCGAPLPRLDGTLSGVVMPIADVAELPRATAAAAAFLEAFGVEPVTAFVPREAGGLVAMNSPPARAAADHEITLKRGTVGRVVNGVVVWPRAEVRDRLGRPPLPCGSNETDGAATLAIGATFPLPRTAADADGRQPAAVLLAAAFDVDADGFLVLREGGSS
jgi:acyl-[acyl-carrier-protein]-phospholipid O-acyltransferase/long-chain-fatty-acid--[acyl-carrier-protein] ligase